MDSKFHNKELSPNEVSTLHMAPVSAGRPHVTFNNLQTEGVLLSVNQSNFEMYFDLNWIFPARKSEPIGMEIEIDKKNLHLMLIKIFQRKSQTLELLGKIFELVTSFNYKIQ